jgi:hypothetical protein
MYLRTFVPKAFTLFFVAARSAKTPPEFPEGWRGVSINDCRCAYFCFAGTHDGISLQLCMARL